MTQLTSNDTASSKSTVTVPVRELIGTALDWAVAVCQKLPIMDDPMGFMKDAPDSSQAGFWVWGDNQKDKTLLIGGNYNPSNNWSLAGEIIDREDISFEAPSPCCEQWSATMCDGDFKFYADSAPTASMRTYVASIMGEEVEVPKRLLDLVARIEAKKALAA